MEAHPSLALEPLWKPNRPRPARRRLEPGQAKTALTQVCASRFEAATPPRAIPEISDPPSDSRTGIRSCAGVEWARAMAVLRGAVEGSESASSPRRWADIPLWRQPSHVFSFCCRPPTSAAFPCRTPLVAQAVRTPWWLPSLVGLVACRVEAAPAPLRPIHASCPNCSGNCCGLESAARRHRRLASQRA